MGLDKAIEHGKSTESHTQEVSLLTILAVIMVTALGVRPTGFLKGAMDK